MLARTNVVNLLPAINDPTMVVGGRQDTVRPLAGSQEIASKIPNARFGTIDAGHFMPTTGPAALLALLKDFSEKRAANHVPKRIHAPHANQGERHFV